MTFLLVLAVILFAVAGIGMAIQKAYWMALVAFGLMLVTLSDVWPHLGLH